MANRTAADEEKLIAKWIEPNPHRPGADEVRIKDYGMSVWAIVGYLDAGTDEELAAIARGFRVPIEVVRAAVAYYRRHKDVLDNRLAANRP
jgi:uncharacterized protein (DUF433 family)